jgi:hypothetical protein
VNRAATRRSARAPAWRPNGDRWAPWKDWRRLSEAATTAAGEPTARADDLTVALKRAAAVRFPVEGASAQAAAECLRRAARGFLDAAPARRALLVPALRGAAESVWLLIDAEGGDASRPPAWLES